MWARHKYCGWVCMHCGHHARQWMSRQVHERRALRGLGCNDDGMKPNVGIEPPYSVGSNDGLGPL